MSETTEDDVVIRRIKRAQWLGSAILLLSNGYMLSQIWLEPSAFNAVCLWITGVSLGFTVGLHIQNRVARRHEARMLEINQSFKTMIRNIEQSFEQCRSPGPPPH